MIRDQKTLRQLKRQPDDTFWADDAELQEADSETLREITDSLEADDERAFSGRD